MEVCSWEQSTIVAIDDKHAGLYLEVCSWENRAYLVCSSDMEEEDDFDREATCFNVDLSSHCSKFL